MYVSTGMGGYRGRGMGDAPATCYYWVNGPNGPVCGDVGGNSALIKNPTQDPSLALITIDEIAGQVGQFTTMFVNMSYKNSKTPMAGDNTNKWAQCAMNYFRSLVTASDVFASDSTARLNRAGNQAANYVLSGACGPLGADWDPSMPLSCGGSDSFSAANCSGLQQVLSKSYDFVTPIAGGGIPTIPRTVYPPPGGPVYVPQTVPQQQQTYYPAPANLTANAPVPVPPQQVYNGAENMAPASPQIPARPNPLNTLTAPGGAAYVPGPGASATMAGGSASTPTSGVLDGAMSWVQNNPLLAAGLAAGLALMFMSGGKR